MNIGVTTDLDTARFVSMLGDLQKISGKDFATVLLSQTAAILKFCIAKTQATTAKKVRASFSRHSDRYTFPSGEVISKSKRHPGDVEFLDLSTFKPTGKKKAPLFIVGGKTWHDMTRWHWSDERWAKFEAFLAQTAQMQPGDSRKAKDLSAALASIGLAKHSWYQIAQALGIEGAMKIAASIKNAKPQDGRTYQNGTAKAVLDTAAAYIELRNDYPAAVRMNGQTLINYAIVSRAKAFEREVELGVFRDLKVRAERYPGLFVTNS